MSQSTNPFESLVSGLPPLEDKKPAQPADDLLSISGYDSDSVTSNKEDNSKKYQAQGIELDDFDAGFQDDNDNDWDDADSVNVDNELAQNIIAGVNTINLGPRVVSQPASESDDDSDMFPPIEKQNNNEEEEPDVGISARNDGDDTQREELIPVNDIINMKEPILLAANSIENVLDTMKPKKALVININDSKIEESKKTESERADNQRNIMISEESKLQIIENPQSKNGSVSNSKLSYRS